MQKIKEAYQEKRGRKLAVLLFGAVGYAMLAALCSQIEQFGATAWSRSLERFAVAFPLTFIVLALLLGGLLPKRSIARKGNEEKQRFHTGFAFLLILTSYLPMFLIEYPGSFTYDTISQVSQIAHHQYSTFHPLLYTLLLRLGLSAYGLLQSIEKCMALTIVIQMVLVSLCFALSCASLSRLCSRRAARWALMAFILWPYHMVFASNYTKDTLFSAFLTLFFALTLEMLQKQRTDRSLFAPAVFCGALACLLRNNMIYAMLVWGCILLIKKPVRQIGTCALAACVLSMGVNAAIVAVLHAEGGSAREMLSVPAQQLARAYMLSPESFGEADRQQLDALIREQSYLQYDPTIADPVKDKINVRAIRADGKGAISLWLRIGKQCPGLYLDAFLNTALPMLYPYRAYSATPDYIETGLAKQAVAAQFGQEEPVQPRRFQAVRDWLDENVWSNGAKDIPVLRWVMNAGAVIWLMLFTVLWTMYTGCWKRFAVLLLPVLLWGTYLLGPVMQGRYLYPFVCLLPLMLAACKTKEE